MEIIYILIGYFICLLVFHRDKFAFKTKIKHFFKSLSNANKKYPKH